MSSLKLPCPSWGYVLSSCGLATSLIKSVLESPQQLHPSKPGLGAMLEPSPSLPFVCSHFPTLLFMVVLKHLNILQQQPDSFKTGEVCSLWVRHREILTLYSWATPSPGSLRDAQQQAKMLNFTQAPFCDSSSPLTRKILTLVQRLYGLWLQPSLFINYIQVKDLLRKSGIICSLGSVGKQLTWNTDKQWQPLLYMYYNTGNKTDQ